LRDTLKAWGKRGKGNNASSEIAERLIGLLFEKHRQHVARRTAASLPAVLALSLVAAQVHAVDACKATDYDHDRAGHTTDVRPIVSRAVPRVDQLLPNKLPLDRRMRLRALVTHLGGAYVSAVGAGTLHLTNIDTETGGVGMRRSLYLVNSGAFPRGPRMCGG